MIRAMLVLLVVLLAWSTPTHADDISDAYGGVGRIIVVLSWKDEDEFVGFGSGFAVTPNRIVTNYHVVEPYARYAQTADERLLAVVPSRGEAMLEARLVTYDSAKDLAILELVDGTMEPMRLFSGSPDLGLRYTALGFPSNVDFASSRSADELFDLTVTPRSPIRTGGDISEARPVRGIDAYVHDADIAGGNSGGPLVDRCGRVIGVNAAVASSSESDSASSFAISYRELARFLRRAEVPFTAEASACVTSEDRNRLCTIQREDAREQALTECSAGNSANAAQAEREYRRQQDLARRDAETAMFVAFALLLFGGLAIGAGGMFYFRERKRETIIAGATGAALVLGAVVVFATRGGAVSVTEPDSTIRDCQAHADRIAEAFETEQCPRPEEAEQSDEAGQASEASAKSD